jgi:hypothetical protein
MILCLPLGIVNETCGLKMKKNQGVVITNNHAFFVVIKIAERFYGSKNI